MRVRTIKAQRILIVEDEMLIAMNLEDMLIELGHKVVAMAAQFSNATALAATEEIDLAILDLNIGGSLSFPVADILRRRNIPFMFASGYGSQGLTEHYRKEYVLAKPYDLKRLEHAISSVTESELQS